MSWHPGATNMARLQMCWHHGDVPHPKRGGSACPCHAGTWRVPSWVPGVPLSPRSDCAILYNDRSVLENHHISAVFRMMQDDEMNIFVNLTKDEFA